MIDKDRIKRQQLQYQASLIENVSDAIVAIDPERRITSWNKAAEKIYGWQEDEVIGQDIDVICKTEFLEETQEEVQKRLIDQGQWRGRVRQRRRNGERIFVMASVSWLKDSNGSSFGNIMVNRDVTKHRQAEEALRESEERFRRIFEEGPLGMAIIDLDYRFVEVNNTLCRMTGYTEQELSQLTFPDITHPDDINNDVQYARQVFRGEIPYYKIDKRYIKKDKEILRVNLTASIIPDENGKALYGLAMVEDITERKQAEEALQRYAKRLEILHQIDQAILTAQSLEEIAQAALGHIRQLVPCNRASVTAFNIEAHRALRIALQIDGETSFGLGQNFLLEKEEIEELQKGKVRQVSDILASSQPLSQKPKLLLADEGFRSFVNVPLMVEDKLIGSLNLGRHSVGYFDQEHIEIAQEVANSLAVAIQNARLAESEQVQHDRQSALLALAQVLGSTLDLQEEMQTLLIHLHRLVPYDAATVQLLEGDRLRTAAAVGFEAQATARSFIYTLREFPLNRQLIEERQPIHIDDVRNDVRYTVIPGTEPVRAFLGIPLLVKGEPVGLITLDSYTPARFSEDDIDLIVAVAAYAAVAIENARLFEAERAGRERLRHLSQQLVEVQEAERRHIARELHDEIGQALTGLKLILDMVPRPPTKIDETETKLGRAQALVDQIMTQIHDLSLDLRPPMLDDLGLLSALLWYFEQFTAQSGVRVNFKHKGVMNRRFATQVETAVYRIVQEALTNVARHADVSEATVRVLASKATLHLQIIDQGVGFNPTAALVISDRNGLAGMQERVRLLGGHFEIESARDAGTSVTADFSIIDTAFN